MNPEGIDILNPRFSWYLSSEEFNKSQSAYQILVASSTDLLDINKANIWDSRKMISYETNQIHYNGKPLVSGTRYFWKARVWDEKDISSEWSETTFFSMGLLNEGDWLAQWIGLPPHKPSKNDSSLFPSPMFRHSFKITDTITRATLYITSLGDYEVFINGNRGGNNQLTPEWTAYYKKVQYQTYDVTTQLISGENVISAWLGDGWYAGCLGPLEWKNDYPDYPYRGYYGHDLRLKAQLNIEYKSKEKETIFTNSDWFYDDDGPIRSSDNFLGEVYDARKEQKGWQNPGFNDKGWKNVVIDTSLSPILKAQMNEPIQIVDSLIPVSMTEPKPGIFVFDMGQNMVGWCKIKLEGPSGAKVKLQHGEMLNDDGTVYTQNLKTAIQTDEYILDGKGARQYAPHFTYHGFRYVQVEGLKHEPDINCLRGLVVSSSTTQTGFFKYHNILLDKLDKNILWTQKGNMHSVPTDCPQRSERMGWMGDAQVFSQTAIYNMDMASFYTKWGQDIIDGQYPGGEYSDVNPRAMPKTNKFVNSPGWADAGIIIPWKLFLNYNDTYILENHYLSMKQFIDRVYKTNPDLIYDKLAGWSYDDWLNGDAIVSDDYPNSGGAIPSTLFCTAFFARSTQLLSDIAYILQKETDAKKYGLLAEKIRIAFNEKFVSDDGIIEGDTQAGYAIALNFGLLDKQMEQQAFERLLSALQKYDGRISTGFIATVCLLQELSKRGRQDLACSLAESHRLPSWGYSIDQGATTIWERWDAYVKGRGFQNPGMNSFNHYAFGSIGEWMVQNLAGLKPYPEHPGFRHFAIEPRPGGSIDHVSGKYISINGPIEIEWELIEDDFDLIAKIPVNTQATITLPFHDLKLKQISINNAKPENINFIKIEKDNDLLKLNIPSGKYHIICYGIQ